MSIETLKRKNPRKALGRGLSALISTPPVPVAEPAVRSEYFPVESATALQPHNPLPESDAQEPRDFVHVQIDKLHNNPDQPRQQFDVQELKELAASITTMGVLQPILVRPLPLGATGEQHYQIVAGERRWRAAKEAGLTHVPVLIKDLDERETLEIALVENVQRNDLNPVEEAKAYQRLVEQYNLTQEEVAEKVGKDRASVANFLRLLKLPQEVIDLLSDESISMGHAKVIMTVREPAVQRSLAKKVVDEQLSVRKLEEIVAGVVVLDAKNREGRKKSREIAFPEVIDRLRQSLGTKVAIKHQRSGKGKIEISYFSEDELDRIVDLLSN